MKKYLTLLIALLFTLLAACGADAEDEETEELATLDVDFIVPETADPGEPVQLEAVVTYGDEVVEDADEVMFEYWLQGNEDDSAKVEGIHTEDGSYVAEVTFPEDGIYEMYAHTTAHGLHTMPLVSIEVGDVDQAAETEEGQEEHGHHEHADGFSLHFMNPEAVKAGEETELVSHIELDGTALEQANVRYEIVPEGQPEKTAWVDAEETAAGEYAATHEFAEAATYTIVIHVEDDADLHEHEEYSVVVE